jgi:hypothetical protein
MRWARIPVEERRMEGAEKVGERAMEVVLCGYTSSEVAFDG